ncbi:MAG TPA: twin-arginine translocation pathway signal, partial [Rhodobacterales bacterium]|nr:twin-arginine translocation pathway signal [Rhodobacterales bacterium]
MSDFSRRAFIITAGGSGLALAGCANPIGHDGGAKIDARVAATLNQMRRDVPDASVLEQKSVGMLVMPLVTEAGFGLGGSYGRGALLVNGTTVDYYAQAKASFGLQI